MTIIYAAAICGALCLTLGVLAGIREGLIPRISARFDKGLMRFENWVFRIVGGDREGWRDE